MTTTIMVGGCLIIGQCSPLVDMALMWRFAIPTQQDREASKRNGSQYRWHEATGRGDWHYRDRTCYDQSAYQIWSFCLYPLL